MNFISIFKWKNIIYTQKDKVEEREQQLEFFSLRTGKILGLFLKQTHWPKVLAIYTVPLGFFVLILSWFFNWNTRDSALQAHSLAGSGGPSCLEWNHPTLLNFTWHLLQVLFWAMEMKSHRDTSSPEPESWSGRNPSHSSKKMLSIPNYAPFSKAWVIFSHVGSNFTLPMQI